jgi:RNA polymerase sigma-70 factor (ECF subfamily)
MSDIEQIHAWLTEAQAQMLRFTQLHISPREDAEDVVQETLVSALTCGESFLGKADFRTYLFAILKNKIADMLRKKYRHKAVLLAVEDEDEFDNLWFDESGHWRSEEAFAKWPHPEQALQSKQFFKILDICLEQLPSNIAAVFTMHEMLQFTADEVCENFQISRVNYWKIMSRARKQIQYCLNQKWFAREAS